MALIFLPISNLRKIGTDPINKIGTFCEGFIPCVEMSQFGISLNWPRLSPAAFGSALAWVLPDWVDTDWVDPWAGFFHGLSFHMGKIVCTPKMQ